MSLEEQLWRTADNGRWFIIPDGGPRPEGPLTIRSLAGDEARVDPDWARRFEVSEEEGRAWAQEEFGLVLDGLRLRIDRKLAKARASLDAARRTPVAADGTITPDAVPALFALVGALPRAILDSLSGDPARVVKANGALSEQQRRLNFAGIDVDRRLADFPYRLASLRKDLEARPRPGRRP